MECHEGGEGPGLILETWFAHHRGIVVKFGRNYPDELTKGRRGDRGVTIEQTIDYKEACL
jgi:hypothetical protein